MGKHELAAAGRTLSDAERYAISRAQKDRLQRMMMLHKHVKQFWDSVAKALKALEADYIAIGSFRVAIVEYENDELTVRISGTDKTYAKTDIPAGIAVRAFEKWSDDRPENKVLLGAFKAVNASSKPDDARRLWQEAKGAGVEGIDVLMPVLDEQLRSR